MQVDYQFISTLVMANIRVFDKSIQPKRDPISPLRNIDLLSVLLGSTSSSDRVELVITLDDQNLNIKDLGSYLDFIYWIDGNLSKYGFASYSHTPSQQIAISRIQIGSWELVIEEIVSSENVKVISVLFLALKYLPSVVKASLDTAYRYYEVLEKRDDYLEKKGKRRFKSQLKRTIYEDDDLKLINENEKEKIYQFIRGLYNRKKSIRAARFAAKSVRRVTIRSKKK